MPELTDAEKMLLGFLGYLNLPKPGGFYSSLIDVIFHADRMNTRKLALGYPELVQAVVDWREGDLASRSGVEEKHEALGLADIRNPRDLKDTGQVT